MKRILPIPFLLGIPQMIDGALQMSDGILRMSDMIHRSFDGSLLILDVNLHLCVEIHPKSDGIPQLYV